MTRAEQTIVLAIIFLTLAYGAFAGFLADAARETPQVEPGDMYPPRPDCDMYRGLPDEFLDCVYPRPS